MDDKSQLNLGALNLSKVIKRFDLDTKGLAQELFPSVKYPEKAVARVLTGEAQLDADQVVRLARYAGTAISDLFMSDDWKGSIEDGCFILTKGDFKARLTSGQPVVTLYRDNRLVKTMLLNYGIMTVGEFTEYINNSIKSLQNGNN